MFCLFCCSFSEGWKRFSTPHLHMKHKHYKIQPPGPQCSVMADWEAVSQWPLTTDVRERGGRPGITMVTRCVTLRSVTLTSPEALLLCPVTCILVSPMWIFVHVLVTLKYKAKSKWRTEKGRTHRARSARLAWILFHWKSANLPWKNRSCRIQTNRTLPKFLSKILPLAIPENRAAKLPIPTNKMAVATINNRVLLFGNLFYCCLNVKCISSGGYVSTESVAGKDILEFNLQTESWAVIGAMEEPRIAHAVSVVSLDDYKKWCNWIN